MSEHEKISDVEKRILIEFYKEQWKAIYDLNNLDWRVALIFVPLIGALSVVFGIAWENVSQEISNYADAFQAVSLIIYLICLYGLWTVAKGHAMSMLKFETLKKIEEALDLDSYVKVRPPKVWKPWPVIACRRIVLFIVYLFLGIVSSSMVFTPISKWHFNNILNLCGLISTFSLAIVIVIIHWYDYTLHHKSYIKPDTYLKKKVDSARAVETVLIGFVIIMLSYAWWVHFYYGAILKSPNEFFKHAVFWSIEYPTSIFLLSKFFAKRLKFKTLNIFVASLAIGSLLCISIWDWFSWFFYPNRIIFWMLLTATLVVLICVRLSIEIYERRLR